MFLFPDKHSYSQTALILAVVAKAGLELLILPHLLPKC